jgi:valyl-tRNA synthetase
MTGDEKFVRAIDVDALPKQFEALAAEARWHAQWESWGLHKWDSMKRRDETFVVDTPPPTVSGSLHVGHVFSYTHQDLIVRYRRMRGQNIFYPMGWDDNGLPTERRVQNIYNVRADPFVPYKPDLVINPVPDNIKASELPEPTVISRQNFINLCHRVTAQDEQAFKNLFTRLGLSADWREEYATISSLSRAVAQRSFLDLHNKGHIYQVEAPVMWDIDFQTAVAQAEVEDRERAGAYHDIEFGTEDGGSFIISTTRPELLAACVGVAAHPDDSRYRALFGRRAITPVFKAPVPIFSSPIADPAKGTGILMVCTFGDQTDVLWWREHRLALRQVLGRDGHITSQTFGTSGWESVDPALANRNYSELIGKRVGAARRIVVEQLRNPQNAAVGSRTPLRGEPKGIQHSVRFYEKGDSPLEYFTSRQWFVRLLDKKEHLIEMGRRIHWRPEYARKRYENWTENLQLDWCISRQRYFGVPIPVWYPLDSDGNRRYDSPIFPRDKELPVDPMSDAPRGYDESQRNRAGGFAGEPDVFDTWFTSSLTPQIAARWGAVNDRMSSIFPMDIRPQSHEIIRTWAFYTIAKAMLHQGDVPWHNVVLSGWILDPDRKKMSKSRGNALTPLHLLDEYGSDAVRYWAGRARLGADTTFDEQIIKIGKRLVTKIYNAGKFVLMQTGPARAITHELDLAFIAELRELIDRTTTSFESFEFSRVLEDAESFFWSAFTDNYLELVKQRARGDGDNDGRASAIATLRTTLSVLLRLFAPFVPIIAEEVWSWTFAEETGQPSIHTASWPAVAELEGVDVPLDRKSFKVASDAIGAVRKAKSDAGVGMGRPIVSVQLNGSAQDLASLERVLPDVTNASNASSSSLRVASMPEGVRFLAQIEPERGELP